MRCNNETKPSTKYTPVKENLSKFYLALFRLKIKIFMNKLVP